VPNENWDRIEEIFLAAVGSVATPVTGPPHILHRFDKPAFAVIARARIAAIPRGLVSGTESRGNIWLMKLPR
jgi:hypothetical protein